MKKFIFSLCLSGTLVFDTYTAGSELLAQINGAILNDNVETLKTVLEQAQIIPEYFFDAQGNNLLHIAFSHQAVQISNFLFRVATDPVQLLCTKNKEGLIPFDFLNPRSDLFKQLFQLAYSDFSETDSLIGSIQAAWRAQLKEPLVLWLEAARKGDLNSMKDLVGKVDINVKDLAYHNYSALHFAAELNYPEIVKFLLEQPGINVEAVDSAGMTSFMYAVLRGHENIIKLLAQKADINVTARGFTAFVLAAEAGNVKIIKLLSEIPGIDINKRTRLGFTPLIKAVYESQKDVIKFLITLPGVSINDQNNEYGATCLHIATTLKKPDSDLVSFLLEIPGINILAKDKKGRTAFDAAKEHNHHGACKLIQNKINELSSMAFKAVEINDIEKLKTIIAQIGVNLVDKEGNTLLHKAIKHKNAEIVRLILLADPTCLDINNRDGKDAIELSVGYPEIFEFIKTLVPAANSQFHEFHLKSGKQSLTRDDAEKSQNPCAHCQVAHCENICSRCKKVFYCSSECQKAHWKVHKDICKIY